MGAFLLISLALFIIGIIVLSKWYKGSHSNYDEPIWQWSLTTIAAIGLLICVIGIPVTKVGTEAHVQKIELFREALKESRTNPSLSANYNLNVFERTAVIESINSCNNAIARWNVIGEDWYLSKWFLHPSTQDVVPLK